MDMDFDTFKAQYEAAMRAAIDALDPRWGVRGYQAHATRDGVAYVFTLTDSGMEVAWVEDEGRGGGPRIDFGLNRTIEEQYLTEARRLFPDAGVPQEDMVEALLQKTGV